MRHDRIERAFPRNGGQAIGKFLIPISGPQPLPPKRGPSPRHVCSNTVSHRVNSDYPFRLQPANVSGRTAEPFARHIIVVFSIACRGFRRFIAGCDGAVPND